MGGGKSQKGGKHGTIGRTLAHDILIRQSQRNEESKKNILKKKEYSVYERSNLDDFTMAATQGLESYIARRGVTREVRGTDFNSQLYEFIHFPQVFDDSNFPIIPIPRRSFIFTEEQKQHISMLNRRRYLEARNASRRYFKRKNKKKVDMYMHGDLSRPYHGYYNKPPNPINIYNKEETNEDKGSNEGVSERSENDSYWDEDLELSSNSDNSLSNSDKEEKHEGTDKEDKSEDEELEEGSDKEDKSDDNHKHYYVNKYLKFLRDESANIDVSDFGSEELEKIELKNFYMWRSLLSEVEAREKSVVTPYEKNIDFWRQLWRVIERSHLILIILDSRDPLFFRIVDLENYIKEIDKSKEFMLVLNKADFLSKELRVKWARYFKSKNIDYIFFSSVYNNPNNTKENNEDNTEYSDSEGSNSNNNDSNDNEDISTNNDNTNNTSNNNEDNEISNNSENEEKYEGSDKEDKSEDEDVELVEGLDELDYKIFNVELLLDKINRYKEKFYINNPQYLNNTNNNKDNEDKHSNYSNSDNENKGNEENREDKEEVEKENKEDDSNNDKDNKEENENNNNNDQDRRDNNREKAEKERRNKDNRYRKEKQEKQNNRNRREKRRNHCYTVGFVGYPNVGKSSLINCLMESTKACVGVQPGKTKHIQTLFLKNSDILLCDCPGLIFPTLVSTKYHLLINNIVSTSHFKGNMVLAVQLICNLIPLQLCKKYDININDCLVTSTSSSHNNLNSFNKDMNSIGSSNSNNNMNSSKTNSNNTNNTNDSNYKDDNNNKENVENTVVKGRKVLFSLKLLELLCKNRNYRSGGKGGQLDYTRASKLIIDDFTQGVLLYCKRPPVMTGDEDEELVEGLYELERLENKENMNNGNRYYNSNNTNNNNKDNNNNKENLGKLENGDISSNSVDMEFNKMYITNTSSISEEKYIGKTVTERKKDEENVNQWLKHQLNKEDNTVKVTKRKLRFLLKGKRKSG